MNRPTSHLFWLLPLGVVACLLAMIYLPDGFYVPLRWLFPSSGPPTDFQIFVLATTRLLLPCLMVAIPVIVIAIWLRRCAEGAFLPARLPRCDGTARIAEVLLLAGMGIPLLAVIATEPSNHGMLLHLDRLTPSAAKVHVAVAIAAFVASLASLIAAGRGRTLAGTLLMAGVLTAYALALNGPGELVRTLSGERREQERLRQSRGALPNGAERASQRFRIDLVETSVVGAELWVNDVYLGKTPYQTTLGEFHRKVPYWDNAPKDASNWEDFDSRIVLIPWSARERQQVQGPVARIRVPMLQNGPGADSRTADQEQDYYARFRYADEWGQWLGSAGGGNDGWYVSVVFPNRLARLNALFHKARLSGYRVDDGWFRTAETFGSESWYGLLRLSAHEPGLGEVLDQWATWKYGLEDVRTADEAWGSLQRICQEAEVTRSYVTCGTAGRAVELLLPQLDPVRLAAEAARLIRSCSGVEYARGNINDRFCFATARIGQEGIVPCGGYYGRGRGGAGEMLPASAFPIAHAVWMMDQRLDALDNPAPNVIEQRVVPEMIRRCPSSESVLEIAASLGGPAIEMYLVRQRWGHAAASLPHEERLSGFGMDPVNKWLYLAAHLKSAGGPQFRKSHAGLVLAMAEPMVREAAGWTSKDLPAFLFYDNNAGSASLAVQMWPRFLEAAVGHPYESERRLEKAWSYLLRAESAALVEMYVEAWRRLQPGREGTPEKALKMLEDLPAAKRRGVAAALAAEINRNGLGIQPGDDYERHEASLRKSLLRQLEALGDPDKHYVACIEELRRGKDDWWGQSLVKELTNGPQNLPAMKQFAAFEDPKIRLLAVRIASARPFPAYTVILDGLLTDSDPAVKQAAKDARAYLGRLTAMPLEQLRSDSPTSLPAD